MEITVTDPQENIEVQDGLFTVDGWPVSFTYAHGKNGALLQCNVLSFLVGIDGKRYLVVSYARPHILDKGKTSKVMGRSIAAARFKLFSMRYFSSANHSEGMMEATKIKGLRIYALSDDEIMYTIRHTNEDSESFFAPKFTSVITPKTILNEEKGIFSAARFERINRITMAKLYRRVMKAIRGEKKTNS